MLDYLLGILAVLFVYRGIRIMLLKRRSYKGVPVMKGAEPIRIRKGPTGVLFIHGFSGTAWDYRFLSTYLTRRNITFVAPLLEGHGTTPEHLTTVTDITWKRQLDKELATLKRQCSRVIVGGDSFGGNLAIHLAARHKVDGLVLLGTPIYFRHQILYTIVFHVLRPFLVFKKKWYQRKLGKSVMRHRVTYDRIPIQSVKYVGKVMRESRNLLKNITCPILIMQSTTDHGVDARSVEYIVTHARSVQKKTIWVPDKYHVFIVDSGREKVFKDIYHFLKEIEDAA